MRWFLRAWSYVSSPLFLPFLVSIWFYSYYSNFSDPPTILKLYLIVIFSVIIPLLLYGILKWFKLADDVHLSSTKERLIPLLIYGITIIAIIRMVFNDGLSQPLYYYFIGILMSTVIALILALFQFKISLHMMGMSGTLAFVIVLSVYLQVDLMYYLVGLSIATGLTATSRLSIDAHAPVELIFGTIVGAAVQIIVAAIYI